MMIGLKVEEFFRWLPAQSTALTSHGVAPATAFRARLERQRAMASRQQYHFSLLLFKLPQGKTQHCQQRCLALTLNTRVRSTDEAGWYDDCHIGLILPYTRPSGTSRLAERICKVVGTDGSPPEYTVYTYPSDSFPESGEHASDAEPICAAAKQESMIPQHSSETRTHSAQPELSPCIRHRPSNAAMRSNTTGKQVHLLGQCPMPNWKRAVDILGSVLGLVILSPLFLIASILIKTVSKGPVFFKQERVGYGGRVFHLWKFRTYEVDADAAQHRDYLSNLIHASQQQAHSSQPPMIKLDHVSGIIPFGKLLRKTCIDELPQLINVLFGQMSLVGPRPAITYEVEQYADWQKGRLDAVPGMTGLWQVSGKNRLTFNEMVRLDIQYSRRKSFGLDIKILLKTPIAVASQIIDTLAKCTPEIAV